MDPFQRKKILVVDDNLTLLTELRRWVVNAGYDAVSAGNGKEALQEVERELPDMIIVDAMMPYMNGFEVARQVRALHPTSAIPIIMLTGLRVESDMKSAQEAGINEMLTKPVEYEALVKRIHHYLKSPFR